MAIYSRSSIQNINNCRFRIRKNKHITLFKKGNTLLYLIKEQDSDNLIDKIYL